MKLLIALDAPDFYADAAPRENQFKRGTMAKLLRLAASRVEIGQSNGTCADAGMLLSFRMEQSAPDHTNEAA